MGGGNGLSSLKNPAAKNVNGVDNPAAAALNDHRDALLRFFRVTLPPGADPEDAYQDLCAQILARVDFTTVAAPKAFLMKAAQNLMIDIRRRRTRDALAKSEELDAVPARPLADRGQDPEMSVIYRDQVERIQQALRELSPLARRTFELYRFEGRSYDDISTELNISVQAARKHVSRTLTHCKKFLEKGDTDV